MGADAGAAGVPPRPLADDGGAPPRRRPSFVGPHQPTRPYGDPVGEPAPPGRSPLRTTDSAPQAPLPPRPRRSALPAVLTAAVVAGVLAVVVAASAVAHRADTRLLAEHRVAPARSLPGPSAASSTTRQTAIDFATPRATGRLAVLSHRWTLGGEPRPRTGSYLLVRVEITCSRGYVSYQPDHLSVFDAAGRLVEAVPGGAGPDALAVGGLGPGERVSGTVAFDLPRGAVTLVLSDDVGSVTAVRVPG